MAKRHANEFLRTSTGRLAGSGILYDDYSEEARLSRKSKRECNPVYTEEYSEYIKELQNQPVTTYKLSKEEMDEYLKKLGLEVIMQNSCKNCIHKQRCDVWKDKQETTTSGWDKNRFALSCREFKGKEK